MIANEMNRASKLLEPVDVALRRSAYKRALRLVDLIVEVHARCLLQFSPAACSQLAHVSIPASA
jgi:hypothetical protein